jgi:hypothetical protein
MRLPKLRGCRPRSPNPGRRARRIQRFPAARTYRSTPGIISPVSRIRSGNGSSGARHCGDRSVRAPVPARRMVTVSGDSAWPWQDPEQEQEWLRQLSLIYSGLIGIGVVMVAPFLTAASLDLSAMVCVVAFSVAIPILAALVVLNRQEAFRRRMTKSFFVEAARAVAQGCAFVGVVAGFWHITWIAGGGDVGRRARGGGGPDGGLRAPGTGSPAGTGSEADAAGGRRTRRRITMIRRVTVVHARFGTDRADVLWKAAYTDRP